MKKILTFDGLVVVPKKEIMDILFHRGDKLLLDEVTIGFGSVRGEFTVTPENCIGHEPKPGQPVWRGIEVIEMGFQLLAVVVAKYLKDSQGKTGLAREVLGFQYNNDAFSTARFNGLIIPGDKVVLETGLEVDIKRAAGALRIASDKFVARVAGDKKCFVTSVAIVTADSDRFAVEQQAQL